MLRKKSLVVILTIISLHQVATETGSGLSEQDGKEKGELGSRSESQWFSLFQMRIGIYGGLLRRPHISIITNQKSDNFMSLKGGYNYGKR